MCQFRPIDLSPFVSFFLKIRPDFREREGERERKERERKKREREKREREI